MSNGELGNGCWTVGVLGGASAKGGTGSCSIATASSMEAATLVWFSLMASVAWESIRASSVASLSSSSSNGN